MKSIARLPKSQRPREKLLKYGVDALTLEELIAVILITGTKKSSVAKLSSSIGRQFNQKSFSKEVFLQLGIGNSKTSQLLAAIELGKRVLGKQEVVIIENVEQIVALSYEIISSSKETLLCFYLNARSELIKRETIAVGSLTSIHVLPREIFSVIKDSPVASIILVHNHPSGNISPSKDDLLFTKRVKEAGEILGVTLLDHLIISSTGWKRIKL